jgi:pyruvyltransferase
MLSRVIVEWLLGETVHMVDGDCSGKLLAVGSVLQYARPGDVVWGTGIHPASQLSFSQSRDKLRVTVLAVRGPISRDVLLARGLRCPKIFGDPAVLMPLIWPSATRDPKKIIVIPHMSEFHSVLQSAKDIGVEIVDPSADWKVTVDKISSAGRVISGSLHGLVVAEAFGVPATWYRADFKEGVAKYYDYYLGTGRIGVPYYNLQDALHARPPDIPDFTSMQNDLCGAFLSGSIRERLAPLNS